MKAKLLIYKDLHFPHCHSNCQCPDSKEFDKILTGAPLEHFQERADMAATTKEGIAVHPIIGCPLLVILAVLSIPWAIVVLILLAVRERSLFRRLAAKNRTIPWSKVEQRLADGEGTLIIEQANKEGCRLWWTPNDIFLLSPDHPPAFKDIDFVRMTTSSHPFFAWCFIRYLSSISGTAFLSRPKGIKFQPGFIEPEFFTNIYPKARIVFTVLTWKV